MFVQDFIGGIEVSALTERGFESLIFNLRYIYGGIPCCKQGRGADAAGDFRRQGVHVITKD